MRNPILRLPLPQRSHLLWLAWLRALQPLRPACSRTANFLWLLVVLAALCLRPDLAGVTSLVRSLGLSDASYYCLLHFFHSPALNLDRLTQLWRRSLLHLFRRLWVAKTPWLANAVDFPAPSAKLLDHVSFGVDRPSRPGQWIPAPSVPHARKSSPAPSAFGAPAFGPQAQAQDSGSVPVGAAPAMLVRLAPVAGGGSASDCRRLASPGPSPDLALEIPSAGRPTLR